jgi:hypothetical protein
VTLNQQLENNNRFEAYLNLLIKANKQEVTTMSPSLCGGNQVSHGASPVFTPKSPTAPSTAILPPQFSSENISAAVQPRRKRRLNSILLIEKKKLPKFEFVYMKD